MSIIKQEEKWLQELLPEGLFYPSSTVISGPGGAGKPLVVLAFVASWLKSGGSVIGIPLQYPTAEFVNVAMSKIYKIDLKDYKEKTVFVQFNPSVNTYSRLKDNTIEANLLKPNVWDGVIKEVENIVEKSSLGVMVFGSALNLLLFSPTYKRGIIEKLENIIKNDKNRTYVFSISTSAFAQEVKLWEEAADNLMYTRMGESMNLFLKITRMKGVRFLSKEMKVPISKEVLSEVKEVAESTRRRIIPEVTKI